MRLDAGCGSWAPASPLRPSPGGSWSNSSRRSSLNCDFSRSITTSRWTPRLQGPPPGCISGVRRPGRRSSAKKPTGTRTTPGNSEGPKSIFPFPCWPVNVAHVSDVTQILDRAQQGDAKAAEELLPLVYEELRKLAAHRMANEKPGHTLQPTALVHEAWLRLS